MGLINIERLVQVANSIIEISQNLPSNANPEKTGGYLTIGLDGFSEKHILEIGRYDSAKKEKYRIFSQEKAYRLYSEWLKNPIEAFSSWQTRDEKADKYGGAVLFNTLEDEARPSCDIISFSGLNEHTDEASSLTLGHYLGLATDETTQRIITISNNRVFDEMFSIFKQRYLL